MLGSYGEDSIQEEDDTVIIEAALTSSSISDRNDVASSATPSFASVSIPGSSLHRPSSSFSSSSNTPMVSAFGSTFMPMMSISLDALSGVMLSDDMMSVGGTASPRIVGAAATAAPPPPPPPSMFSLLGVLNNYRLLLRSRTLDHLFAKINVDARSWRLLIRSQLPRNDTQAGIEQLLDTVTEFVKRLHRKSSIVVTTILDNALYTEEVNFAYRVYSRSSSLHGAILRHLTPLFHEMESYMENDRGQLPMMNLKRMQIRYPKVREDIEQLYKAMEEKLEVAASEDGDADSGVKSSGSVTISSSGISTPIAVIAPSIPTPPIVPIIVTPPATGYVGRASHRRRASVQTAAQIANALALAAEAKAAKSKSVIDAVLTDAVLTDGEVEQMRKDGQGQVSRPGSGVRQAPSAPSSSAASAIVDGKFEPMRMRITIDDEDSVNHTTKTIVNETSTSVASSSSSSSSSSIDPPLLNVDDNNPVASAAALAAVAAALITPKLTLSASSSAASIIEEDGGDDSEEEIDPSTSAMSNPLTGGGDIFSKLASSTRSHCYPLPPRLSTMRRRALNANGSGKPVSLPSSDFLSSYMLHHTRSFHLLESLIDCYTLCLMSQLVVLAITESLAKTELYASILLDVNQLASHFVRLGLPLADRLMSIEPTFMRDNMIGLSFLHIEVGNQYSDARQIIRKIRLLHHIFASMDIFILPKIINAHKNGTKCVAIAHQDANFILTAGFDQTVRIWDLAQNTCLAQFCGHASIVTWCAFSSNDAFVASASFDSTLRIWNARTAELRFVLTGHTDGVLDADIGAADAYIVSGGMDCTVRLWSTTTGKCVRVYRGHRHWVKCVAFTHDGQSIISGGLDRKIFVWSIRGGGGGGGASSSVAGGTTVSTSTSSNMNGPRHSLTHADYVLDLLVVSPTHFLSTSKDSTMCLWSLVTGDVAGELANPSSSTALTLSLSHDRALVAAGLFDNTINIYDVNRQCKLMRQIKVHNDGILCIQWLDNRTLAVGTATGNVQLLHI